MNLCFTNDAVSLQDTAYLCLKDTIMKGYD